MEGRGRGGNRTELDQKGNIVINFMDNNLSRHNSTVNRALFKQDVVLLKFSELGRDV